MWWEYCWYCWVVGTIVGTVDGVISRYVGRVGGESEGGKYSGVMLMLWW